MTGHSPGSSEPLVEPLTRREQQVLRLLAENYSRPEIAEQLTVTLSSVKFHTQNIFSKLGVNSKKDALRRAAELGLLENASSALATDPRPVETGEPPPKHNLPLQFTRFFGREAEIDHLKARLAEHRLVTLTGSGGVGKTRLLLRVAEDLIDDFADGVWFVTLASLADAKLVPNTVGATLGLRNSSDQDIADSLTVHLRRRQVLLVLERFPKWIMPGHSHNA